MIASVRKAEADEGSPSPRQKSAPWQKWTSAGMTIAVKPDVPFNASWAEGTWDWRASSFAGLAEADKQVLLAWQDRAEAAGIDTVLDLAVRPWNIAGAGAIFGVFEFDKDQASWLIVRYGFGWTLARCSDGFVSDVSASLPDILSLIDADLRT
jgi:hypothetical protein